MSELVVGSIAGLASNSYVVDVSAGSTLDLTNSTGTVPAGVLPTGTVLQVVSTTKTDVFTVSASVNNWYDITGLSAAITPQYSNSKIMVIANVTAAITSNNQGLGFRIERDGTPIGVGDTAGNRMSVTSANYGSAGTGGAIPDSMQTANLAYLDSPATTSAVTYNIALAGNTSGTTTAYVNRTVNDANVWYNGRGISSITVMEVAG